MIFLDCGRSEGTSARATGPDLHEQQPKCLGKEISIAFGMTRGVKFRVEVRLELRDWQLQPRPRCLSIANITNTRAHPTL